MGCLIRVIHNENIDTEVKKHRVWARHWKFLGRKNTPIAEEELNGRQAVKFYVEYPENETSRYLVDTLLKDRDIFKADIIS